MGADKIVIPGVEFITLEMNEPCQIDLCIDHSKHTLKIVHAKSKGSIRNSFLGALQHMHQYPPDQIMLEFYRLDDQNK